MSNIERELDLIIFGATSFTAKYVIEEVVRNADKEGIRWAISGRDERKLKNVLNTASEVTGIDVNRIPIIIADVQKEESVRAMTARTRLVLNLVGPYALYGEPVVNACVRTSTHYMDITIEIDFMDEMRRKYNSAAKESGVCIVFSSGFTTDLWLPYVRRQFNGEVNSVESFTSNGGLAKTYISAGYWNTIIEMAKNAKSIKHVKKENHTFQGLNYS